MNKPARPVRVVTDSTADIPAEVAAALGITVIPLVVIFGEQQFADGIDLSGKEFYAKLAASKTNPSTAAPASGVFSEAYARLTDTGNDVLAIMLSGSLSSIYSTASLAADELNEQLGEERVVVLDSRAISMCMGWLAIVAARASNEGKSLTEIAALVEERIPRTRILGALSTLEYLQRGGRIGMAQAFLGGMLNVKPLLHLKDGEVKPLEQVRTTRKALQRIVEIVQSYGPLEELCVLHGYDEEEAQKLVELLAPIYPADKILLAHIGAVLGTHVGPKAAGVACVLKGQP